MKLLFHYCLKPMKNDLIRFLLRNFFEFKCILHVISFIFLKYLWYFVWRQKQRMSSLIEFCSACFMCCQEFLLKIKLSDEEFENFWWGVNVYILKSIIWCLKRWLIISFTQLIWPKLMLLQKQKNNFNKTSFPCQPFICIR